MLKNTILHKLLNLKNYILRKDLNQTNAPFTLSDKDDREGQYCSAQTKPFANIEKGPTAPQRRCFHVLLTEKKQKTSSWELCFHL